MRRHRRSGPRGVWFIALLLAMAARPADHKGSYGEGIPPSYVYVCRRDDCDGRPLRYRRPQKLQKLRCPKCHGKMKRLKGAS